MGYIGIQARAAEIGGDRNRNTASALTSSGRSRQSRIVQDGPYRLFKLGPKSPAGHPLYAGNFFLVSGMLVALWPAVLVGITIIVGFILEYWLIAYAEERQLVRGLEPASGNQRLESPATSETPTRFSLNPALELTNKDYAPRRVRFSCRRPLAEWPTVVLTCLCWSLALAQALLRQ